MNRARAIGGILGVSLGLAGTGFGQRSNWVDGSDVRVVSSFVAAGETVPCECRNEAHLFAENLMRYPRADSWHWVLLCDEAVWQRFLRLSGRPEGEEIYASTDLEAHTTYLRGAKLFKVKDFGENSGEVVVHELAHIYLNSSNEAAAENLVRMWQRHFRPVDSEANRDRNAGN